MIHCSTILQKTYHLIGEKKLLFGQFLGEREIYIGSTFSLDIEGKQQMYTLSYRHGNNHNIYHKSPLGRAILYAKVGDIITYFSSKKQHTIKVLSIS